MAQYPYRSNYEFYYQGQVLELEGNYFGSEIPVIPYKDVYQLTNKNIVDAFRNIYTGYRNKNISWLKKHTKGSKLNNQLHTNKYLNMFKTNVYNLRGYAVYDKYAILFLIYKPTKEKFLFILEKDKYDDYNISTNFKQIHPVQYKIIDKAFKGQGEFKIVKEK